MSGQTNEWQARIEPSQTAFFLDVDGTLLDFKETPEEVVADTALRDLLQRLRDSAGGAVAFVSGRMVSDLDRIMAPLVYPAGGVHGADLRFADGRREAFEGAAMAEVRAAAEGFVAEHDGLRFEDKGGTTFAIHFRRVPELGDEVARFLEAAVSGHDLMVQGGKMVAEVKPKGCHKGVAIETLMRTPPFAGRIPFFIGDDLTDEHGFETVNAAGGISVKVGAAEETTVARHRVADVAAVRDLLNAICPSGEGTQ